MATAPKHRQLKRTVGRVDTRRVSASEAGYDWRWSKPGGTADQVRERDGYMCVECVRLYGECGGMLEKIERDQSVKKRLDGEPSALKVDHIIPAHIIGPERFHDMDNLQTLCEVHHWEKTLRDIKRYGSAKR